MTEPKKTLPLRTLLGGVLLVLFGALLFATYAGGAHPLFERIAAFYSFAANHTWLLLGLYVLRLPFFLPASFVLFLTGMICGPLLGELIGVCGLALGGSIEFLIVRSSTASLLGKIDNALLNRWRAAVSRAPFHAILMMRVCFVPFDAVTIAAAVARAPFRAFLPATLIGVTPTSLPIIISGASVDFDRWVAQGRLWPGEGVIHWPYVALSVVLAILVALHARHRAARPVENAAATAGSSPD